MHCAAHSQFGESTFDIVMYYGVVCWITARHVLVVRLIEFSQSFVLLLSLVSGFKGKAAVKGRAEQKGAEGRGGVGVGGGGGGLPVWETCY